ncbi:MAG: hypothetical protein CBC47_05180 [Alphaproteobacteria bacterium TMED87]|nr:hypothetical protein [Rhodospirillaceae bacterium]OUV09421.1 MAG: hypothetical protein CBC47_05180 [Alphaproteobacteria bacterium TMED87]|tara:strand:+ start:399 stop:1124 length:726 start_codon:yes stop_codon:yes gene_type:complete
MQKTQYEHEAVTLLRSHNVAILSTISKRYEDFPFGSLITYVTDQNRSIYIYASDIAEHTKNILNNPKSCLTIFNITKEDDKQNSSRLSIMGNFNKVEKGESLESCKDRFFTFLPKSEEYSKMHDFNFYKLEPQNIRWIGGFGEISWLKDESWKLKEPAWTNDETSMVEHMNNDHKDVVIACLKGFYGVNDNKALMIGLSIDGYYLESHNKIYYIPFDKPCLSSKEVRKALVVHAKKFKGVS